MYTPPELAASIVRSFPISGRALEPCKGRGAFVTALEANGIVCDWCEIDEGRDFFGVGLNPNSKCWDWIVTNPPWSQFRTFLGQSMKLGDNVLFLCLVNAFFMRARVEDMERAGFGLVRIEYLTTPPKPWPQTGFQLGAVWIQRGWKGPTCFTRLSSLPHL